MRVMTIRLRHGKSRAGGWVSDFKQTLEHWLIKRRHLKGLKIWFDDQNLQGNQDFNAAIQRGINNSALFFILNSHNYQDSEYCRTELKWFMDHNQHKAGGIMVGDLMRPFNILLNNIPYTEWPEMLQEKMCFHLHDAPPKTEGFGDRLDMGCEVFIRQMSPIIHSTVNTLEALTQQNPHPAPPKEKTNGTQKPLIFFADVADTLKTFRNRLMHEIADEAEVLPLLPPPYVAAEHKQHLQNNLQQASLSIHLLDQWGGHAVDDIEDTTFPRLQADTACEQQQSTLLWRPDSLDDDDFEDEVQAEWLNNLETDKREHHNYQYVRSSRQELIDQIRQMLEALNQQHTPITSQTRFMIDTHQKDQMHAYKLAGLLAEHHIDVDFNKESDDPVKNLEAFDQAVRDVQHLIITFGQVTADWLKGRLQRAMQVKVGQIIEETDSAVIWVFLPSGCDDQTALPKIPSNFNINYLRCDNGKLDTAMIQPLLNYQEDIA